MHGTFGRDLLLLMFVMSGREMLDRCNAVIDDLELLGVKRALRQPSCSN